MTAPAIQRRSILGAAAAQRTSVMSAGAVGFTSNPFVGIGFSPAFVGFCAYMLAIITYRFPIGTAAMVIALVTLPFEKHQLRLPALAGLSIALVAWAFLGLTTTVYPDVVVVAVSDFAKVCAVIFVAANVLVTRSRFRAFVVGTLILWALFPIRGTIFAYFIYHGDVEGRAAWNFIYSNPNDLASLCLLELSMALGVLAVEKRPWVRMGTQLTAGLLVLVIVLTQSRGAIIALSVVGLILGRKYIRDVRAIISVVILAAFVFLIAPDSVWRRFSTIKEATNTEYLDPETVDLATRQDQSSSQQRLAIWDVATSIVSENIFTGVGLGAYRNAHEVMAQRPRFDPAARGPRDTHSTYLNIMAETGIPGFVLFVAIIVLTLKDSRAARKKMGAVAPAFALQLFNMEVGLYGFLVAGIWGSYGAMVPTYVHLVLMHVASKLLLEQNEEMRPMRGRKMIYPAPVAAAATTGRTVGASA
jgi:putative inorganic carbon (hco3(-)) transporter